MNTTKESFCACKHMPVVSDNNESDSDTDTHAIAEQPDEPSQEIAEKRKRLA